MINAAVNKITVPQNTLKQTIDQPVRRSIPLLDTGGAVDDDGDNRNDEPANRDEESRPESVDRPGPLVDLPPLPVSKHFALGIVSRVEADLSNILFHLLQTAQARTVCVRSQAEPKQDGTHL